mmetsp:Transcript_45051/g.109545  ORF Transcript_45051/g.109545 Transcript_45051/m.109545 type:complete len:2276 (-) Transcript_45051:82-6909(-)
MSMEDNFTTNGLAAKVVAGADRGSSTDEDSSKSPVNPNNSNSNTAGQLQQELPFLVTHWLANYGRGSNNVNINIDKSNMPTSNSNAAGDTTNSLQRQRQREDEALSTIRRATSELASAFSVLGAYGATIQPSLGGGEGLITSPSRTMNWDTVAAVPRNSTYSDVTRRYASGGRLAPNHLEHLAQAASLNAITATVAAQQNATPNLLLQASTPGERLERSQQNERSGAASASASNGGGINSSGRTIQEAIVLDNGGDGDDENSDQNDVSNPVSTIGGSALYRPALISAADGSNSVKNNKRIYVRRTTDLSPKMDIMPTRWEVSQKMADSMRQFLDAREKVRSLDQETSTIDASLSKRRSELKGLNEDEGSKLNGNGEKENGENNQLTSSKKRDCDRVISQLERKLNELTVSRDSNRNELTRLQRQVSALNESCKAVARDYFDPFENWKGTVASGSRVGGNAALSMLMARERGLAFSNKLGNSAVHRRPLSAIRASSNSQFATARKNIFETRIEHAVTIHAHSSLPVFCLRFDRTGRYFISGADDFLMKVFYIGADKSSQKRTLRNGSKVAECNYGANVRGAVLVCTLRGHTNVIVDIHVSPDNSLLATSSDDGDVRIWNLKNGCPIAILRGHANGANGVSWSPLTPYRLLTTGSDGIARLWDIRDACLKRDTSGLGKRSDYKLQLSDKEEKIVEKYQRTTSGNESSSGVSSVLPPLPPPPPVAAAAAAASTGNQAAPPPPLPQAAQNANVAGAENGVIVPPLPAAVPPLGQGADSNALGGGGGRAGNGRGRGPFVANDMVDEGVKLMSKYQHGSTQEEREQQQGPGTRARRASVRVVCISYCPLGGQFVTGTDDGICRVWESCDDVKLEIIDDRHQRNHPSLKKLQPEKSGYSLKSMQREPLLKLMGHLNAIADLSYSNAGDRILSASERDGVVRLWNVGVAPATDAASYFKDLRVTQTVIKLTNPASDNASDMTQRGRRRPMGSSKTSASKVYCNCAVWTHDDSKVITSQSILKKETKDDIQPGSQYLFLWDSMTGVCLMGISGAHEMQCSVVIPHPYDSSIVCTGGGDGKLHIWDWEHGKCIFTHENKAMYPDGELGDGGYLDGSFSPDGTSIVLADDAGQVSIFDVTGKHQSPSNVAPTWMREQYFADDYYEVEYDLVGHCFDKRSGKPPHLSPKAARCNFGGSAYSEEINDTFRGMPGPSPLSEDVCRWNRDSIRKKHTSLREASRFSNLNEKVRVGVRGYDSRSTILIKGEGFVEVNGSKTKKVQSENSRSAAVPSQANRRESQNYRYLDYQDLLQREGEEEEQESEDEDFEPTAPRGRSPRSRSRSQEDEDMMDEDDDDDDFIDGTDNRSRRRSRNEQVSNQRRERAERRARRHPGDFVEIDSDDEPVQYCSTNTNPNGAYLRDITSSGHFWRIRQADVLKIHRKWLHRSESDSSYNGKKIYVPQVGDSVVYIPRAHLETIDDFPSFVPPWQNWPQEAEWPVVRCFVRGCRYRFPFSDYFRTGQISVVAILTLEVTGIPELSSDRSFPWPKPTFVAPSSSYVFELSLFENNNCDYLVPEVLYTSRLKALEANLRSRNGDPTGLEVDMFYERSNNSREDPTMEVWLATIDEIEDDDDRRDTHLRGSGYGVVQVSGDDYSDVANPWELNTDGMVLTRPGMSQEDKTRVLNALTDICKDETVAEQLTRPVNSQEYYDYDMMVEVPMDVMFIKRRVNSNYYNSTLAVVADLRLVRDNCIKYNTAESDISEAAVQMCDDFEQKVLSDDDRSHLISEEEFNKICHEQANGGRSRGSLRIRIPLNNTSASSIANSGRYTLRDRTDRSSRSNSGSSNLELHAPPPAESPSTNSNRRSAGPTRRLRTRGTDVLNRLGAAAAARNRPGRASRSSNPRYRDVENSDQDSARLSESNATRRSSRQSLVRGNNGSGLGIQESSSTRRSSRLHALDEEDEMGVDSDEDVEEEDEEEAQTTARSARQRSTRSKRNDGRNYDEQESEDSDEDDGASEESDVQASTRRGRAARAHTSPQTLSVSASSGRRSSRATARNTRTSYEEIDSDEDEGVGDSSEEEEEEEELPSRSSRRAARRTSKGKYASESSEASEGSEESVDGSDDDEMSDYEITTRVSQTKRKRNASQPTKQMSKKKRMALPELAEWPEIGVKDITRVTNAVLERLSDLDTFNAFDRPVLEYFPDLQEEYLSVIEEPMDFRTIEEERLHAYRSIRDLQNDLILTFQNCCTFNAEGEEIWEHAASLWGQLNEVFVDCCKDLGVLLPRRW